MIWSGLSVVEVGDRVAVGAAGRLFSDLGAEVVVLRGGSRKAIPPTADAARTAGKRIVRDTPKNSRSVDDLLSAADVVLTSSDDDATSRRLVAAARRSPDRRIVCDITAFGSFGPLAGEPASDVLLQAWTGAAWITGRPDGPPVLAPIPALDMETGVYAVAAACAALMSRAATGRGQLVEVAVFDVAVNALAAFLPLPLSGRPARRNGNRHPTLSPWNTYPTSDGWVMLCAPTDDQWRRLCEKLGRPELVHDPAFATSTARMLNADLIDEHVGRWTRLRTRGKCEAIFAEAGLPCGPIVPLAHLPDEPNIRHRVMARRVDDPEVGHTVLIPGSPLGPGGPAQAGASGRRPHRGAAPKASTAAGSAPLDGVRVVEIGMNTVGPLAGRQLGALGADVIKVEPPAGDSNRSLAPLRDDGQSYMFALSNTDKRGIVLDLKTDDGRRALWNLLASADVLIENLKPGSLDRLGFGAAEVRARFPRLVYCSMNGFGHDSAYPGRPALDTVVQAMSGVMDANLDRGVPTKLGISLADQLGGLMGLTAVLAALVERAATGTGHTIDIAMQDAAVWSTYPLWNSPVDDSPVLLPCADGFLAVDRPLEPSWEPHLLAVDGMSRVAAIAALRQTPVGPHIAPVLDVDEVLAHDHTRARGLLVQRETPDGSSWMVLETPLRLSATPARVRSAMPALGWPDPTLAAELAERESQPATGSGGHHG